MTVSFHRHGQLFFPGTGSIDEIGFGAGKHYTLNIPFESGLTDSQFWNVFQPVMQKVMDAYQPGAVVLQCGGSAQPPCSSPPLLPLWAPLSPCMHAWLCLFHSVFHLGVVACVLVNRLCMQACLCGHMTLGSSNMHTPRHCGT